MEIIRNVLITPSIQIRKKSKFSGVTESTESISLAKRLITRPSGVVSKNDMGERRT